MSEPELSGSAVDLGAIHLLLGWSPARTEVDAYEIDVSHLNHL